MKSQRLPEPCACDPSVSVETDQLDWLTAAIEHAAHLLPSQAPISVFVHHNTLHAFESSPFHEAVQLGSETFGCQAYLPLERYRRELARGRILPHDLATALLEDLDEEADRLIGFLATRYQLRLAMLQHPVRLGSDAELEWLLAESDVLEKFCPDAPASIRARLIYETRRWAKSTLLQGNAGLDPRVQAATDKFFERFGRKSLELWSDANWESFTLHLLWQACLYGANDASLGAKPAVMATAPAENSSSRRACEVQANRLINEELIRFCAAFLDQGVARWRLPSRDRGLFRSFLEFNRSARPHEAWLEPLAGEIARIERQHLSPQDVVEESLAELGIDRQHRGHYLGQVLLELPGWAGMLWQMETNAEWTLHPAPAGTLAEYLAVRLLLKRLAIASVANSREPLPETPSPGRQPIDTLRQRAYLVYCLAQMVGWCPADLFKLTLQEWQLLTQEIEAFTPIQRQRVYQHAYERRFRTRALDALIAHDVHRQPTAETPRFQVMCCLDEREESFRRHLEEAAPDCETFGIAGFYGVAMYYRGVADAHYVPLCPVVVKPRHYVAEEVGYSFAQSHRRRRETRRALGRASHKVHVGSRLGIGGTLTAMVGSLASVPLVARVLFPRLTARIRSQVSRFVQPPTVTRLHLEREADQPGKEYEHLGYSIEEMVDIAERGLRDVGLTKHFSRLILLLGHGSSSLNNPHQSAYDCGACGGARGGPNARALASMLNDPRVRERLIERGITIPRTTCVIGAFHNTCNDHITYFDLERLPSSHHGDFEAAQDSLDEARRRNALERCRRFESAGLNLTPAAALRHVEGRAEDLSQVRAELGHATNAMCFVGRRSRVKGLFLDRRCFLTSYDPTQDTADSAILNRLLQAAIPVCAGINLEYFFSYVDSPGYGCGSKLPHNITSLLGVMDGAASDLRTGLPWQMVEIHEPIRILFVIETTTAEIASILERNPPLLQLVRNEWVQLAILDPESPTLRLYRHGRFEPYQPESSELPVVDTSRAWYGGLRDHLGFASIVPGGQSTKRTEAQA